VAHAEVEAAAGATDDGGATPTEVLEFLVSLLRYNDNAINGWDDSDLRATVVAALGTTKVRPIHTHTPRAPTFLSHPFSLSCQFSP
jgi:hypothetical protein